MALIAASGIDTLRPIGFIDPAGVGRGWHYTVFESPHAPGILLPEIDDGRVIGYHAIRAAQVTTHDFGSGDLPATVDAMPLVYIAPDGTLFSGAEADIKAAITRSLRAAPAMWQQAALSHLEMVRYVGAADLLPDTLRRAYTSMCKFPRDSGSFWAMREMSEAVKPVLAPLVATIAPTNATGSATRNIRIEDFYWVRNDSTSVWLCLASPLHELVATLPEALDLTLFDLHVSAFGLTYHGIVDGGERPSRWRPASEAAAPASKD